MAESQPEPDEAHAPTKGTAPGMRFRALLPYLLTALAAVVASLGLQLLLTQGLVAPSVVAPIETTTALTAAPAPTVAAPLTPVPTPLQTDERVLSQEILDLRADQRALRSALYLMRAASQVADAEAALNANSVEEVERVLVTARASLDRAYALSPEQEKGPISEFRVQLSRFRDDLRVRPEGLDQRMRRLRLDMLNLIDQ